MTIKDSSLPYNIEMTVDNHPIQFKWSILDTGHTDRVLIHLQSHGFLSEYTYAPNIDLTLTLLTETPFIDYDEALDEVQAFLSEADTLDAIRLELLTIKQLEVLNEA